MSAVRIGALLPAMFNLNADVANAHVLARRLNLSGVDSVVVPLDEPHNFARSNLDALVIGSPSSSVLSDPHLPRAEIATLVARLVDASVPVLAVSNGFHLLGTMRDRDGQRLEGLGLIPVDVTFGPTRHVTIGARVSTTELSLVGVENHNGRVDLLADGQKFGDVIRGIGNDTGGAEGFVRGSLICTHLHGPLFALNPEFADRFSADILARRGEQFHRGEELDELDGLANAAARHLDRAATS